MSWSATITRYPRLEPHGQISGACRRRPTTKVTDLAKRGFRAAVRGVLDDARRNQKRTVKRDLRIDGEEDAHVIDLIADPLNENDVLLVFQDVGAIRREVEGDADIEVDNYSQELRVEQLEDELDETRSKLRTTVEELETSNEELKSSNEEMMSMNEELQSTNEELATVNEELKNKVDQLGRTNSDLQNFIESTQVPTIFLDRRMRIRSFTPATRSLFRFQDQDRGRLFSDVVSRVDQRQLELWGLKVLETGNSIEEELSLEDGKECYVLRVLPYRDANGAIDGVILVFSDVTKIRQTQADLARNEGLARRRTHEIETLYKTAPVGMAVVDRNHRYLKINQRFADLTDNSMDGHIGRSIADATPVLSDRLRAPIDEIFERGREVTNVEVSVRMNGDGLRDYLIDFYPYEEDGRATAVGIILKDVTELRRLEKELRRLMDELQHRVKNTLATVASIVNQTVAVKNDKADLVDTLKRRIGALAATHNLLTSARLAGCRTVGSHRGRTDTVRSPGPHHRERPCRPTAAQTRSHADIDAARTGDKRSEIWRPGAQGRPALDRLDGHRRWFTTPASAELGGGRRASRVRCAGERRLRDAAHQERCRL